MLIGEYFYSNSTHLLWSFRKESSVFIQQQIVDHLLYIGWETHRKILLKLNLWVAYSMGNTQSSYGTFYRILLWPYNLLAQHPVSLVDSTERYRVFNIKAHCSLRELRADWNISHLHRRFSYCIFSLLLCFSSIIITLLLHFMLCQC